MTIESTEQETKAAATLIQSTFRGSQGRREATDVKLQQIKEHEVNLELQAIWQILLTGFEVIKFPSNGRPRKRIMWLTLDGKLCVGKAKSNEFSGKFIHLKYALTLSPRSSELMNLSL